MLLSLVTVRLLGREGFGELAMIQSTIGLMGILAGLGLGLTATKYTAEFREKDSQRLDHILALLIAVGLLTGFAMAGICFALADLIALYALERITLAPLLRIASVMLVVSTIDGILLAILAGFEAYSRIAKITIVSALLSISISLPLVYSQGLKGAVLGQTLSLLAAIVYSIWVTVIECRRHNVSPRLSRAAMLEWQILWQFSLPALAANLLVVPVLWIGNLILVRTQGGYGELGVVRVVDQLRTLVTYAPTVILAPTLSIMANSAGHPERISQVIRYGLLISTLVVFPLGIAISVLGPWLLSFLYGPQFVTATSALAWAMIIAGVQCTGATIGNYLNASGRMWLGLGINLLWAVLFLGLAIILIPRYQANGYLAAMGASYVVLVIIVYTGFLLKAPFLLGGFPLLSRLIIFIGGVAVAAWVQHHVNLVEAAGVAIAAASAMVIFLFIGIRSNKTKNPFDLDRVKCSRGHATYEGPRPHDQSSIP